MVLTSHMNSKWFFEDLLVMSQKVQLALFEKKDHGFALRSVFLYDLFPKKEELVAFIPAVKAFLPKSIGLL